MSKQNKDSKFRPKGDRLQGRQTSVNGDPYEEDLTKMNSNKSQRRARQLGGLEIAMSRSNPITFYNKYDRFSRDAARLPFARPVGTEVSVPGVETTSSHSYYVPGLMRLRFTPAIGISKDYNSPINKSSIRFLTYLRSNQKATWDYDHQDVSLLILSVDSAYMFHALLRKMYGIVNNMTPTNEYYSRSLIAACGGIYSDLRKNLQDFRAYINAFAYQLGQYALPKDITLFDRHRWMCEGYYVDSPTSKAQTYMFVPNGFWKYDSVNAQCVWKEYLPPSDAGAQYTTAQLMAIGDELINALSNDDDFAHISGDIYNFYGGDTYKLPYVDENYKIYPAYDKTVLSQIENATVTGPLKPDSLVIKQNATVNEGAIVFEPIPEKFAGFKHDMFMNFHWDSPTSDDVIEASRLMAIPDRTAPGEYSIVACGTEIVTCLDIYGRKSNGNYAHNPIWTTLADVNASNIQSWLLDVALLAQFDWAPGLRLFYNDGTNPEQFAGFTWDIDVFDNIPDNYLSIIHMACLFSLFQAGPNSEEVVSG